MKRTPPPKLLATLFAASAVLIGIGSGCATKETPRREVGSIPPGSFVKAWEVDVGLKKIEQFHLGGETLLVYGGGNEVVAYDTKGGQKFRTLIGDKGDVIDVPMVQAERIIFPMSSTLEVVSHTGQKRPRITLPSPLSSGGTAVEETVYAGTSSATGGRLTAIALDRDNPRFRREVLTRSIIDHPPVVHENVVYAATTDGRVYAVNSDLTQLWGIAPEMPDGIFRTDGKIEGGIKADEGGVYVPSTDGKLYCLDLNTGRIRWQYIAGVPLKESPITTSDTVYIRVRGRGLVALDKKAGPPFRQPRWTSDEATQLLADDASHTYVLTKSGRILALDKATGKVKFQSDRNDFVSGVTHVDAKDSTIYVLTKGNDLLAVRPVLKTGVVGELALLEVR